MHRVLPALFLLLIALVLAASTASRSHSDEPVADPPAASNACPPTESGDVENGAATDEQAAAAESTAAASASDNPSPDGEDAAEQTSDAETPADDPREADRAAIQASVAAYVEAFNQGDAAALAALWSENGKWITPDGESVEGRAAIEAALAAYFAAGKSPQLDVLQPEIRFLADSVAVEEGHAIVRRLGELPSETTYTALHVKEHGQWRMESVRETSLPAPASNFEHLRDLDWMVGVWVDQTENVTVTTTCRWTRNYNFMVRSYAAQVGDRIEVEGTQVIGYDAAQGVVRSWVFDSDGGFGEGVWTRDGDRWLIKASQTLRDGSLASSLNVITYIDPDTFTWQMSGREVAGELQPGVGPITVVRAE